MYCHDESWYVEGLREELAHMTLCFEAETRRLWILPNPTDPTTRFLDVMKGRSLPQGEYHLCVTLWDDSSRVYVRQASETEGNLGERF